MPIRWGSRVSVALLASVALSACFPPFFPFPPFLFGPDAAFAEHTLVVENATDDDWVVSVTAGFPTAFAIRAGETGEVMVYDVAPTEVALLDVDCTEMDELAWDGSLAGVRISPSGTLTGLDEVDGDEDLTYFAEYWECGAGGAPAAADALPGATGSVLLIGGDGSAWMLDVATPELGPVTTGDDLAAEHALSPDGSHVAFSAFSDDGSSSNVYVALADGSDQRLLVEDAATPVWSPDGTRIAYIDLDPFTGPSTLSVIDVAGGEAVALAEEALSFRWSPDGERIAFISGGAFASEPVELPPTGLRIVNVDGSGLETLAEAAPDAYAPAWSPDGSLLAFTACREGPGADPFTLPLIVQVYDMADGSLRTIADRDASLSEPAWSPDGTRLAFTVSSLDPFAVSASIGVTSANGGPVAEIGTVADAYYTTPLWSPDGVWLAAARTIGTDVTSTLVAMRPDGDDEVVLATDVLYAVEWRSAP